MRGLCFKIPPFILIPKPPPMNLHEYQAKQLFAAYGIPVPNGRPAESPADAAAAAQALGGSLWVVKAQVHAGGRGKAGGVKLCRSTEEVRAAAASLLGGRLVTHQTGPEGLPVNIDLFISSGNSSSPAGTGSPPG